MLALFTYSKLRCKTTAKVGSPCHDAIRAVFVEPCIHSKVNGFALRFSSRRHATSCYWIYRPQVVSHYRVQSSIRMRNDKAIGNDTPVLRKPARSCAGSHPVPQTTRERCPTRCHHHSRRQGAGYKVPRHLQAAGISFFAPEHDCPSRRLQTETV